MVLKSPDNIRHADASIALRVLCLGDVVGREGRRILKEKLPQLKSRFSLDAVIVNGENAAGGLGITKDTAQELFAAGADIITTGNHIWRHKSCFSYLNKENRLLRPANYPAGAPGKGVALFTLPNGEVLAVINLIGRTFMEAVDCPFHAVEKILAELPANALFRIVDIHAEATSEKRALGHFLDGRVSAVVGTHTHVQTADAMILPGKTAYLSDLGMCGCEYNSVLGVSKESSIARLYTGIPHSFTSGKGQASLNGALIELDPSSGKALAISLVRSGSIGSSGTILSV